MPEADDIPPIDILINAFNLPPEQAIKYLRRKGYGFSWNWHDILNEAHARAFTVAKVVRMDVLKDIRDMVQKAIDEGITFEQFRKELEPVLKAKNWWGKKFIGYPDGTVEKITEGSIRRLKTIFRTNTQAAFMAGRYKDMMDSSQTRPYWQYIAVMDSKTRPAHSVLNGKTFRYDDPFWSSHYPPNGFNCRCRVRSLSEGELARYGATVESSAGSMSTEQVRLSRASEKMTDVAVYRDPATGIEIAPDPGWSYNPGRAAWQPDLDGYGYATAREYIRGAITGPDFKRFLNGEVEGSFPVAVLDTKYRKLIDAKSQTVYLSDETLAKNKAHHPEITIDDYVNLPSIIEDAQLIVQDGDRTLVFITIGERVYYAAIKSTRSGETLFLTSLRLSSREAMIRIKRTGRVVRENMI